MCVKSALHDVNTLMTEKSIISTIDQIEAVSFKNWTNKWKRI